MSAASAIDAVAAAGVPRAVVSKKWERFRDHVAKFHPRIERPTNRTYLWRQEPVDAAEALARLVGLFPTKDKVKAPLRDALVDAIGSSPAPGGKITAARERQFRLDPLHAVAELAGEVEELAYDTSDAEMIVERLRARVKAAALEQFGQPGDTATFDPGRHDVMGERPADGAAVTVLRPGYAWQENGSPLVLRKALVVAE